MGDHEGHGADPDARRIAAGKLASPWPGGEASSSAEAPEMRLGWHHRVLRRLMHGWFLAARGMTLGVRALVLDAEGRVFLVRHSYIPGWYLPGGGIEPGQTAREALAMELREEGNIALLDEPALFGFYLNRHGSRRDHVALYVVRHFRQTAPRPPDREIVECGFFPLDALPVDTSPGTRRRIAECLEGLPVAECW